MPRPKPTAIGISAASRPGVASSRSESLVQMSTTLPYSGFVVPSMIPGMLAELAAHLEDDGARRPGHRVDRQSGEEEHDGGTDDDPDERRRADDQALGVRDVLVADRSARVSPAASEGARRHLPRVVVGAEQRRGREDGGGDGDALGDGLGRVADRVELGEDLGARAVDVAGHLRDALGVVRDRAEGVHGDDDADRGQQAGAGDARRGRATGRSSRRRAGRRGRPRHR